MTARQMKNRSPKRRKIKSKRSRWKQSIRGTTKCPKRRIKESRTSRQRSLQSRPILWRSVIRSRPKWPGPRRRTSQKARTRRRKSAVTISELQHSLRQFPVGFPGHKKKKSESVRPSSCSKSSTPSIRSAMSSPPPSSPEDSQSMNDPNIEHSTEVTKGRSKLNCSLNRLFTRISQKTRWSSKRRHSPGSWRTFPKTHRLLQNKTTWRTRSRHHRWDFPSNPAKTSTTSCAKPSKSWKPIVKLTSEWLLDFSLASIDKNITLAFPEPLILYVILNRSVLLQDYRFILFCFAMKRCKIGNFQSRDTWILKTKKINSNCIKIWILVTWNSWSQIRVFA